MLYCTNFETYFCVRKVLIMDKYLFCYFTGNLPKEESVHFAVSEDGYNFTALNNNEPVIKQMLGRKCCRDPYVFRDEENVFHIILRADASNYKYPMAVSIHQDCALSDHLIYNGSGSSD